MSKVNYYYFQLDAAQKRKKDGNITKPLRWGELISTSVQMERVPYLHGVPARGTHGSLYRFDFLRVE